MAYAAVINLKKTILRLPNTSSDLKSSSQIQSIFKAVCSFKDELERLDRFSRNREEFDAWASQIREAAWKLEDALDLHGLGLSTDEEVHMEIKSFTKKAKKIMEIGKAVEVFVAESHTDEPSISSESYHGGERLGTGIFSGTICIQGMAGIGKTTYALELFEKFKAKGNYKVHAFVTVGQNYHLRHVLLDILSQIGCDDLINVEGEEKLGFCLRQILLTNTFLLLLDDVWDVGFLTKLSQFLPKNNSRNQFLVTTRRELVTKSIGEPRNVRRMSFLSPEESWDLFCANAFQEGERCPHELVEVGKKIADCCEGLPLAIITVAKLLAKTEKTVEYWLKVANGETSVFEEASEEMSPILLPSYLYLPMYLKQCFLYLGVFPWKSIILPHKMSKLLKAEEFLEDPHPIHSFEDFAIECLSRLSYENVTIKHEDHHVRLHFSYWYLCVKEAERGKFYKVIKRRSDAFSEGIERERRLCIHNNVLFGIKDVYKSLSRVSTARSVLCTGSFHQYLVPLFLELRLLRVLDAETIRFYEFPIHLVKLVQLRYLSLTCNGKLPTSISQLYNLWCLTVKEYLCIRHHHVPTYLPMEIWDMKELKHLYVEGAELPEPVEDNALLENLTSLMGVSGYSCTKRILERIPNITLLNIYVTQSGTSEIIGGFNNFHYLRKLEWLFFAVQRHMCPPETVQWPVTVSSFPSSLTAITLSKQGYPWTMLTNLAKLPWLEFLKVYYYGCRGPTWTVSKDDRFMKLRTLYIWDTDLEHWEVEKGAFPVLENLSIKHCYKLKQLPTTLVNNSITKIVLIGCNPLLPQTLDCYRNIRKIRKNYMHVFSGCGNPIHIHQSFEYSATSD